MNKTRLSNVTLGIGVIVFGATFLAAAMPGADPGWGLNKSIALATGGFLIISALLIRGLLKSKVLTTIAIIYFTYLAFDVCISILYFTNILEPPSYYSSSVWVFEGSDKTVHFDPIRGYTLTQLPSRWARVTRGTVEYVGVLKGNNQGFPDSNDFFAKRRDGEGKRWAVFGDSFSAGQYLKKNWPDSAEELSRFQNAPVTFLNFSIDGGGLANWWSILTKLVYADRYEIDGIVFAVYPSDLRRKFTVSDHRGEKGHARGRVSSWDPNTYPLTLEAARPFFETPYASYVVSSDQFDRFLNGSWTPPLHYDKRVRLYFAWQLWTAVQERLPNASPEEPFVEFDEDRKKLLIAIKQTISAMDVPVVVVHVPSKLELLEGALDQNFVKETRAFAELLGARFIDGKKAFEGQGKEAIRAMWLPYDAHWGQGGSDRFAQFMVDVVVSPPPAKEAGSKENFRRLTLVP